MKKIIFLIIILISSIALSQEAIILNGKIKVFNQLPKEWNTPNKIKIVNFRKTTEQDRYNLGFRQVVKPTLTTYQRQDIIYFDSINDVFTYAVIDFTQAQIDAYDQSQLDNDTSANKLNTYLLDGQLSHKRIWNRIMREYDSGDITNAQFEAISNTLFDAMIPLEFGLWKVAKSKVDLITPPTNAKLLAILDKVKEIINNYINNNY